MMDASIAMPTATTTSRPENTGSKVDFRAHLEAQQKARFRDRGGFFNPTNQESNPILEAMMKLKPSGKSATISPKKYKPAKRSRSGSVNSTGSGVSKANISKPKPISKGRQRRQPSVPRGRSRSESVASAAARAEIDEELVLAPSSPPKPPSKAHPSKSHSMRKPASKAKSKGRSSSVGCLPSSTTKRSRGSDMERDYHSDQPTPSKRSKRAPPTPPISASLTIKPSPLTPKSGAPLAKSAAYNEHVVALSNIAETEEHENVEEENALLKFVRRVSGGALPPPPVSFTGNGNESTTTDTIDPTTKPLSRASIAPTVKGLSTIVNQSIASSIVKPPVACEPPSAPNLGKTTSVSTICSSYSNRSHVIPSSEAEENEVSTPGRKALTKRKSRNVVPIQSDSDDIPMPRKKRQAVKKQKPQKKSVAGDDSDDDAVVLPLRKKDTSKSNKAETVETSGNDGGYSSVPAVKRGRGARKASAQFPNRSSDGDETEQFPSRKVRSPKPRTRNNEKQKIPVAVDPEESDSDTKVEDRKISGKAKGKVLPTKRTSLSPKLRKVKKENSAASPKKSLKARARASEILKETFQKVSKIASASTGKTVKKRYTKKLQPILNDSDDEIDFLSRL